MDRPQAWHHVFGACPFVNREASLQALASAGVITVPREAGTPVGMGIVFFEQITDALCDFVRGVSRDGLERVLAVGASRDVLTRAGAMRLLRSGTSDVFAWDHSPSAALEIAARLQRWRAVDHLVGSPLVSNNLIGGSATWISVLRKVVEVARFTDSTVLITGESGTGKELIARLIHSLDSRPPKGELVVLDCTTIVPELSGSEFFGHERGAFTGASGPREGAFALANGGTLFLDEVGELPPTLQAQLLRVVQEHAYKRVGGNQWTSTSFRLVCATNRDLSAEVASGRFRSDLYYRMANVVCRLPPLRDRPGDILPLFEHCFAEARGVEDPTEMDSPVHEHLLWRAYPGNVRELKQLAARVAYRHVGPGPITLGDLPEEERATSMLEEGSWHDDGFDACIRRALVRGVGLKEIGRVASETAIRIALDDEQGNVRRAAHRLGVTDRAVQMRQAARRQNGSVWFGVPPISVEAPTELPPLPTTGH